VTAGTILHRTKLPLTTWLWTAHLISTHSNGISALQLASQIGVKLDTAWLLLHKFRAAMIDREQQPLYGLVEIDQTEVPFRTDDSNGVPEGRIVIIGAVEIVDRATGEAPKTDFNRTYKNTRPRRVRLAVMPDETQESVHAFVRAHIAPGSTLLTDGYSSYLGLSEGPEGERYVLDQRVVGKMAAHIVLFWIHRVFSLMKRWGMGTFHGFRARHLDRYLEEYAFRLAFEDRAIG